MESWHSLQCGISSMHLIIRGLFMSYLSIRNLSLNGKRVFIRVDFNVPLQKNEQGVMEITSDKRIEASLPTIQYALDHGAGLILASHLGRPKGKPNAEMSLRPVAARLEKWEEHTSELQSLRHLVCRLLLEK